MRPVAALLLPVLTMMAVLSCSGSDGDVTSPGISGPVSGKDLPIAFSGSLSEGENVTRAGSTTALSTTHQTFHAWAYKNGASSTETVMRDFIVNYVSGSAGTTESNSNGWEYVDQQTGDTEQSIKYWDFSASAYRFFGYAGSISGNPAYSADPASVSLTFAVDATADLSSATPLFSKLWYRTGTQLASIASQPVTLEFLLPVARVRFMFTFANPADKDQITLEAKEFKPTDTSKKICRSGTLTVTYPLSGTATEESWSVTTGNSNELTALTQDYYESSDANDSNQKKWYVVLPARDQGTYTLSLKVNGSDRTAVVPAQYMTWAPGFQYTYIFKITDGGEVELDAVQAGFTPWTVIGTQDHEVYNW